MLHASRRAGLVVPEDFEIHSHLRRNLKARLATLEKGKGSDCTTAEAFAFGSLMREGVDVRISRQDAGRGMFSQRGASVLGWAGLLYLTGFSLRFVGTRCLWARRRRASSFRSTLRRTARAVSSLRIAH